MEIIENFYIKKSRRKHSLWKCIRGFFVFSVFPTKHSPPNSPTRPPCPWGEFICRWRRILLQNVQGSSQKQELPGLRRGICCPHPLPGSPASAVSFSPISLASILTPCSILHVLCLDRLYTLFWLPGSCLTVCSPHSLPSVTQQDKISPPHVYSWRWIILGKKQ